MRANFIPESDYLVDAHAGAAGNIAYVTDTLKWMRWARAYASCTKVDRNSQKAIKFPHSLGRTQVATVITTKHKEGG